MSNKSSEGPRYFRCDDFAITMPVSECKDRRRASKLPGFESANVQASERKSARFMTKRCAECTLFRERTSDANTISHEQMMEHLNTNPSEEPATKDRRAIVSGSLRTPHIFYGNSR